MTAPLLPFPLTICGIDELPQHAETGVSHALTILDPGWADPVYFKSFGPIRRTSFRFHDIVNPQDGQVHAQEGDVKALLDYGTALRDEPVARLLIHCHMGLSRSTAAAVMLMAQRNPGREAEAFAHLRDVRPYSWPNSRLIGMADQMLGRGGALVAAMKDHHRAMARLKPEMMDYLRNSERAAEVPEDV